MELSNGTDGIHFISRDSNNNGCVAFVKKYNDIEPFEAGLITVTMGGSYLLSSFVQVHEFYTAQNIKVLKPKTEMTLEEKLLYCAIIQHNRFRYHSHAREANSTFDSILVPKLDELKKKFDLSGFDKEYLPITPLSSTKLQLNTKEWKLFKIGDLFNVELTKGDIKADRIDYGPIPLISSGESNNGIVKYILEEGDGKAEKFSANNITLDMFCHAYYHPYEFYAVGHGRVNILKPKFKLNKYLAVFICSLIDKELYRFSYGRAVYSNVAKNIKLKLPAILNANCEYEPDWQWMEDYIKGLPYSGCL